MSDAAAPDPRLRAIRRDWRIRLAVMGGMGVPLFLLPGNNYQFSLAVVPWCVGCLAMAYELDRPRRLTLWGTTVIFPVTVCLWVMYIATYGHWWDPLLAAIPLASWAPNIHDLTKPLHRRALGGDPPEGKRRRVRRLVAAWRGQS